MHLCLQQPGPQWVQRHKDIRVCLPSPPTAEGQVLLFEKQAEGNYKITHNDQRHGNDRPPPMARKGNHPFMGAPYRACQRHEPPQSAKMLSWDFLVLWMRSGQPHQNHVRAAGEFQNRTQRSESQNAAGRRKRPTPPASDSFVRPLAFASLTSFFALSTSFFAS